MMIAPAAISATFSEWRMVKSRKVLQLVFELPLEKQGEVLAVLGVPLPDAESWVAIAPLNLGKEAPARDERRARASELGKARYRASPEMEQALIRAARLPKDERFQRWVAQKNGRAPEIHAMEFVAADYIRSSCCRGESRKLIAEDRECFDRFIAMESSYLIDIGAMTGPR
jgi:hypothetical protein